MAKKVKKQKKVPLRTCIGCGQTKSKQELLRIVRTPQHKVVIDAGGKMNGRGTYVCYAQSCVDAAVKGKKFDYALNVSLGIDQLQQIQNDIKLVIKKTVRIS